MNPKIPTQKGKRIDPEWWKYIPFGENTFRTVTREEVQDSNEQTYNCQCDPSGSCINCQHDFMCLTGKTEKELQELNEENIKLKIELKQLRRRFSNF